MKRTLSVTLSRHAKDALKPNVSASIDTIVREFNDPPKLEQWMDLRKTSCLLRDTTMNKLLELSEETGHPVPRIVAAMVELHLISGIMPHKTL